MTQNDQVFFPLQATRGSFLNQKSKEKNMVTILAIEPVTLTSRAAIQISPWDASGKLRLMWGSRKGKYPKIALLRRSVTTRETYHPPPKKHQPLLTLAQQMFPIYTVNI